jgi:hypothetical protein
VDRRYPALLPLRERRRIAWAGLVFGAAVAIVFAVGAFVSILHWRGRGDKQPPPCSM